jgi:murein DD-endopeptidase MepM/ murein hydrolase activator NlpD
VPGAITIVMDGAVVCTVWNEDDAQSLLNAQLTRAEKQAPQGWELLYAAFDGQMETRAALLGEPPLALAEADALLQADEALLPTYIVARKTEYETIPFETTQQKDKRLPHGSRLVLQVGRTGVRQTITTGTYRNGALVGDPTVAQSEMVPTKEYILVGTYLSANPDGNPGRSEGEKGRKAPEGATLILPVVNSGILSNFGTRRNLMHNGIDVEADVGDEIISPASGQVVFLDERGNYGLVLEIDMGDGFIVRLTPLRDCAVRAGDTVVQGQRLGALAQPVDEEADPHLHMELLIDGLPYNPRQYIS